MINYLDMRTNRTIYSTKLNLILNDKNRYTNSVVFLLTPNYHSSINMMNNKYIVNRKYVTGYYFEPSLSYYINENHIGNYTNYDNLVAISEANNSSTMRNPTKPRDRSVTIDGKKIVPTKKTANPLRDPKSLMRHLRYDMRRAKYKLNKTTNPSRSNIGGSINDPKSLEKNKELLTRGKTKEINRKKREEWIEKNLKHKNEDSVDEIAKWSTIDDCINTDEFFQFEDMVVFNNSYITEANQSSVLKRILYKDRIYKQGEVLKIYKSVKKDTNGVVRVFNKTIDGYRGKSFFFDLSYYNEVFMNNNSYKNLKGYQVYSEFLSHQLNNGKLDDLNYTDKVIIIPIHDWIDSPDDIDIKNDINPISIIVRALKKKDQVFLSKINIPILFFTNTSFFKADLSVAKDYPKILTLIRRLVEHSEPATNEVDNTKETVAGISTDIVTDIDNKFDILNKTPEIKKTNKPIINQTSKTEVSKVAVSTSVSKPISKNDREKKIEKAKENLTKEIEKVVASSSDNKDLSIMNIDDNKEVTDKIMNNIAELEKLQSTKVNVSAARSKRMDNLNAKFNDLTMNNKKLSTLLYNDNDQVDLKTTVLDVDSPNDGWKELTFTNFDKSYDIDKDITEIIKSFTTNKTYPISLVSDIKVENTSTSQDYVVTYTVPIEDMDGTRSKLIFDIPILLEGNSMMLKGNYKTIQKQIAPIPVCKIDQDTSQITTNYKKVTVSIFGADGKAYESTDTLIRLFNEINEIGNVSVVKGSNRNFYNNDHIRPIDFLDLSIYFSRININIGKTEVVFEFDLKELQSKLPNTPLEEDTRWLAGYTKTGTKLEPIYIEYSDSETFCGKLTRYLNEYADDKFMELYNKKRNPNSIAKYSRAKILGTYFPVVFLCCFYDGLQNTLRRANIKYVVSDKRPSGNDRFNCIKCKDCYVIYDNTYETSMLLNGLSQLDTNEYTLAELDTRTPYIEYMNTKGYNIKTDGLLNFKDLIIDPITVNCCKKYNVPEDFQSMLIYASNLLTDNKYVVHTDMSGRRIRSTEIISGYLYQALSDAYQEYANQRRRGRKIPLTLKKTAVLDKIMLDPTFSDRPLLNDLQIFEAMNSVSYKGLLGMNQDRAYSLDKRTYDPSMINIIGMATGFSGNVGINRQLTIDPNIVNTRGYVKTADNPSESDKSVTKTFTMTEALCAYSVTRNDPARSAMNFIQTSSHSMKVSKGSPVLVTTGADQALPYLSDNTFSFKAPKQGKVTKVTSDYIHVTYKDGTNELIDIREKMLKNSNGGFYTALKLIPTVKAGDTFKVGKILAYDKGMYSADIGLGDTISYKLGTLAKVAILNTDEGFEDSAVITESLSDHMASDIVEIESVTLSKNTNILNIVSKGDLINEGDPLIVFQDAKDEEYLAQLMDNLNTDSDKYGIGNIPKLSPVTGIVKDIKIYKTIPESEMTKSLRSTVRKLEKSDKEMYELANKSKANNFYKYKSEILPATGRLKGAKDGVLIEFYLEYHDKMGIGDKLIYLDGVKGVTQRIIPKGLEPRSKFRPEEEVSSLLAKQSIEKRMVTSIRIVGGINKALIELDRSIKEELGIKWKPVNELGSK